jgi:hypothetical protein
LRLKRLEKESLAGVAGFEDVAETGGRGPDTCAEREKGVDLPDSGGDEGFSVAKERVAAPEEVPLLFAEELLQSRPARSSIAVV